VSRDRRPLVTGGAGFIGTNVARRLLDAGHRVLLFDNLSRAGSEHNLAWLLDRYGKDVEFQDGDVRDAAAVRRAVARASVVFHLSAQVAVTTSLVDPMVDFEVNARGTLTLLEELRRLARPVPLVYTSTNKVYGCLEGLPLRELPARYEPEDPSIAASGIDERWPLELASPYGCSKGAADQYVLEYSRSYRLPTVVARMSCIYGPHQMGCEDQGWVAHFLIRALQGRPITLYGDGKQVRDILFVDDLVDAFFHLLDRIDEVGGRAFNVGGGPANAVSLLELIDLIGRLRGSPIPVAFADWRASDQRYYVTDTRRLETATGWRSRVSAADGVRHLHDWLLHSMPVEEVAAPLVSRAAEMTGEVG
jgi:CDP-paratose 2-epimerase